MMTDPVQKEVKQTILLEKAKQQENEHSDVEYSDVEHSDVEHSDVEHSDVEHSDVPKRTKPVADAPVKQNWKKVYRKKSDIKKKRGRIPASKQRHMMDAESRSLFDQLLRRERERKKG